MRVFAHQNTVVSAIAARVMSDLLLVGELGVVRVADVEASVVAVVVFKCVGFFTVNGEIADLELLVGHAERDAADVFDECHDEGCPDDVPADDEKGTDNLETDLTAIASDGTSRVGDTKGSAALFGGPET